MKSSIALFALFAGLAASPSLMADENTVTLNNNEKDIIWVSLNKTIKYNTNLVFIVCNIFSLTNAVNMKYDDIAKLLRDDAKSVKDATEQWRQINHVSLMEAIEDLLSNNKSNNAFELPTEWKGRVVAISQKEMDNISAGSSEERRRKLFGFLSRHPHARGINTFARPGISKDGSVAIFCSDAFFGAFFYVLIKKDNKWLFFDTINGLSRTY